jgi:hypothetical protein
MRFARFLADRKLRPDNQQGDNPTKEKRNGGNEPKKSKHADPRN